VKPAKMKETKRTLTCDRCGVVVSPTGWPENHVCISQSALSPTERMDDAEFERLRAWSVRYGEWSDPGEISLALGALIAEARRARESEAGWIKDATALSDGRDRLTVALKKAEEVVLAQAETITKTLDVTSATVLRLGIGRDAAEAKLKKAEEERASAYKQGVEDAHRCEKRHATIDTLEVRVETLEKALRDLIEHDDLIDEWNTTDPETPRGVELHVLVNQKGVLCNGPEKCKVRERAAAVLKEKP
jgi:hypothetical protein